MNGQNPHASQPILTRVIPTPGYPQIVSLQAGWWDCLDWMVEHKGVTVEIISTFCWDYIQESPTQEFAAAFEYYVHCYMMSHRAALFGVANENFIGGECAWDKPHPYRQKLERIPAFGPDKTTG